MSVRLRIYQEKECVYNHETIQLNGDLKILLTNLRDVQSGVNDFLSTLIQQQDVCSSTQKITTQSISSDIESDSVEEEEEEKEEAQVNPKKCNENMSTILSNEAQLRYMTEWFQEWSEMQRNDFLGVLLENCGPPGLVNGLVAGIEKLGCEGSDRPPSLFQCRVKLFREWSNNWSQHEKDSLLAAIKNTDSKFAEKYEERLSALMEDKQ